jgi:DDE superfamily endonuclease
MNSNGSTCLITVDGVDCRIQEPGTFDKKWYSHKFQGPGVRYEVGICIQTGWIVWVNGPFPCGAWSDLRIARAGLQSKLQVGEMYVADRGYQDGFIYGDTPSREHNTLEEMKRKARARHETINGRLKMFHVLSNEFRHRLDQHAIIFLAVANIVQLGIQHFGPPFHVQYDDTSRFS